MAEWNADTQQWDVSDVELDAMVAAGDRRTQELREQAALVAVTAARYLVGERRVCVDLANGTSFLFPVDRVQGLEGASEAALGAVEVWGAEMLAWPALDVHVSVTSLFAGVFGSRRWMTDLQRERGAKGGRSRSVAKADAARANGKRGGRPRKTAP